MNKQQIEFMISLFEKIEELRKIGSTKIIINEAENGKPYWTIDIYCKYCNSTYEDCIIFYADNDFDYEEILKDFDIILDKAKAISK